MNAVPQPLRWPAPTRELIEQSQRMLEAGGYTVDPIGRTSVIAREFTESFDLIADRHDLRRLVAVTYWERFDHRLYNFDQGEALRLVSRQRWAAQLIGWRPKATGWTCRRAALVLAP